MRTALVAAFVAATLATASAGGPAAPHTGRVTDKSHICMMQDSVQPKAGLAQEYHGKTYWLCCQMCVQSFTADPNRFTQAKDPVTGALVDKATAPAYALNGKAFFFASEKTLDSFAKDPERFLRGS